MTADIDPVELERRLSHMEAAIEANEKAIEANRMELVKLRDERQKLILGFALACGAALWNLISPNFGLK